MEASQEVLFAKTLEQVRKQAKEQGNCIEREQVEQAFVSLSLSKEQLDLVFDYLEKHKIGIGEPVDPDEYLSEEEINYLEEYQKELALLEEVSEYVLCLNIFPQSPRCFREIQLRREKFFSFCWCHPHDFSIFVYHNLYC